MYERQKLRTELLAASNVTFLAYRSAKMKAICSGLKSNFISRMANQRVSGNGLRATWQRVLKNWISKNYGSHCEKDRGKQMPCFCFPRSL